MAQNQLKCRSKLNCTQTWNNIRYTNISHHKEYNTNISNHKEYNTNISNNKENNEV